MRTPTRNKRPRKAQVSLLPAPTGGLVKNRNLALANGPEMPPGAEVLENYFPTATGVVLRRGSRRHATMAAEVKSMFTYTTGAQKEMFAASDTAVFNLTNVSSPYSYIITADDDEILSSDTTSGKEDIFGEDSTEGLDVFTAVTSGDWVVIQFTTAGGTYLVGVNGEDTGFIYDGTTFYPNVPDGVHSLDFNSGSGSFQAGATITGGTSGATAVLLEAPENNSSDTMILKDVTGTFVTGETITGNFGTATTVGGTTQLVPGVSFPSGVALTTADLSYVWAYKNRIWFIQKNSLDAWYMPVDQVGGELTKWPMGGVFPRGGSLIWGQAWSLYSGGSGGLSDQCVFATTEGDVAAYQGLSPEPSQGWEQVGLYRVGKPMGKHGFIKAGGDLVIATTVGFVSLAEASKRDYAALGQGAVSYPIEDLWGQTALERGRDDWRCQIWANGQMTLISPPTPTGSMPLVFAVNTNTGKWCTITGWDITAMVEFQDGIYFGTSTGAVRQGWVGGRDEKEPYVGRMLPLFNNMQAPASLKVLKMARAITRSAYDVRVQLSGHSDYKVNFPAPPSQGEITVGNEWDNAVWGESVWNEDRGAIVSGDWVSVGGSGHDVSIGAQTVSNALVPSDMELVRIDVTYVLGDAGT